MSAPDTGEALDIFLVTAPGLEDLLAREATEKGFRAPKVEPGGVTVKGGWAEVWRANLELRGASRVLVRLGAFRAMHLAQLDKRARKFPWNAVLRPDVPVRVEATCRKSKIYHHGAAAQRIARALAEELGAPVTKDAAVVIKARILDDLCTISLDTSGDALHKRGHKEAVNKAPMRENLGAMILKYCGYEGREPVLDPMCGSGTFVIEAAEIAAGLVPGRTRAFAFEHLATFDEGAWQAMREVSQPHAPEFRFYGYDRDGGAVRMAADNARRAGVGDWVEFHQSPVGQLQAPDGPAGLIIANPPYGARIGKAKPLQSLYQALGARAMADFSGWRVGVVTNADNLAKATGLPFVSQSAPISHGGISVKIHLTAPLP